MEAGLANVSDLCIGKPPLRSVPLSATVADALAVLKRSGDPFLAVEKRPGGVCVGKICFVDIVCFLCAEDNVGDPVAALGRPVSEVGFDPDLVHHVDPDCSILEALDVILNRTQNLLVPLGPSLRRKNPLDVCWLSHEDFARFFLNSIVVFSTIASASISTLDLIAPCFAIDYNSPALAALPLLKSATAAQTAVAVVTDEFRLIGEISPSTLAFFGGGDESIAAAIVALSAGELITYIDCGGPPDGTVKERLRAKGLNGMLELVEEAAWSSTSSSEEEEGGKRQARRLGRSRSYSARMMGRRPEEAIVCHKGSSLLAVMIQALAHRVSYVWVVEDDYRLAGVVGFSDVLRVFRDQLV